VYFAPLSSAWSRLSLEVRLDVRRAWRFLGGCGTAWSPRALSSRAAPVSVVDGTTGTASEAERLRRFREPRVASFSAEGFSASNEAPGVSPGPPSTTAWRRSVMACSDSRRFAFPSLENEILFSENGTITGLAGGKGVVVVLADAERGGLRVWTKRGVCASARGSAFSVRTGALFAFSGLSLFCWAFFPSPNDLFSPEPEFRCGAAGPLFFAFCARLTCCLIAPSTVENTPFWGAKPALPCLRVSGFEPPPGSAADARAAAIRSAHSDPAWFIVSTVMVGMFALGA
jgi:hypothetical protein